MAEIRRLDLGTDHVLAEVEDRVATITLNRPERRNAFSNEMLVGLALALEEVERDPEVGCVVLTGAGKGFCAGGDVKAMNEANQGKGGSGGGIDAAIHRQRLSQRATSGKVYNMPKPVLASLPGAAAGAGFSLAMACDLRIASERAVLTTAFGNVGFSGDFGGTFFLTQLVGAAKARELYFLPDRLDAEDAQRLGLFNWVVPAEKLAAETRAIATRLAHGPTVAYRYMKENLNRAVAGEMGDCMDLEATHHVHTGFTEDHRNAVKAFVEKKTPVFQGK
ncbi:MAG: enoyl-CoA hydratase [Deltaproteobacteria bacterium]|nr:enoyl-CoA hydratase [Deltaproteobacteria bacterium]